MKKSISYTSGKFGNILWKIMKKIFEFCVQGDRFLLGKKSYEIILQIYLCISLHLVVTFNICVGVILLRILIIF